MKNTDIEIQRLIDENDLQHLAAYTNTKELDAYKKIYDVITADQTTLKSPDFYTINSQRKRLHRKDWLFDFLLLLFFASLLAISFLVIKATIG